MIDRFTRRAKIVSEALPYIMEFHDKVIVIKYGGSAMHDPELKRNLICDVVLLKYVGMHPVIVHGGGPDINRGLKRKKVASKFIQGLRVTTKEVMQVVESVLGKKINREIVSLVKKQGGKAKGFYGKKGRIIKAHKHWIKNDLGHYIDLGFTGTAAGIRYRYLRRWIKKGYIPVLSPIGVGRRGKTYNINADSAAAAVASFLKASKLILLTDVPGVLDRKGELVSKIDAAGARKMINQEVISGGMIPKVKCCLHALRNGVEQVHILDGRISRVLLLELFTDAGIGTMVVK